MQHFDMLVLGSGPGGQRAAIQGAKLGKRVAIVEQREIVGGVTAHTGTIPSKTLREAVLYLCGWREKGFYGRSYRVKADITVDDLMQRLHATIRQQIEIVQHQLTRNGVTVLTGQAIFRDSNTLRIVSSRGEESLCSADYIVVATGTVPYRPADVPFDDVNVIDSDGILGITSVPRTMVVIGAGVIGVEYATIFSALDTKITVIDGRPTMLDFVDADIVDSFRHELQDRGIALRLGEEVDRVERRDDGRAVTFMKSGRRVISDLVMVAAGRMGATGQLDLAKAGLAADDRGRLAVDEQLRTIVPHIYAVGDVIGFPALASTSAEQGRKAACHAFGVKAEGAPELFPFGIYAVPEISIVGRTEQQLRKSKVPYETGVARFRETARGQIQGGNEGMLKLIFGLQDRRLLGVHIVGEGATELIHIGQAVMAHQGGLDYFINSVFNYPTLAEAYKTAALDAWNRIG
jgi:NAD(P) transhydrogenase